MKHISTLLLILLAGAIIGCTEKPKQTGGGRKSIFVDDNSQGIPPCPPCTFKSSDIIRMIFDEKFPIEISYNCNTNSVMLGEQQVFIQVNEYKAPVFETTVTEPHEWLAKFANLSRKPKDSINVFFLQADKNLRFIKETNGVRDTFKTENDLEKKLFLTRRTNFGNKYEFYGDFRSTKLPYRLIVEIVESGYVKVMDTSK